MIREGRARSPLKRLARTFPKRRRVQFALVLALTLIGALAELISIGAVIPFLQVVAAPEALRRVPAIAAIIDWLKVASPQQLLIPAAMTLIIAALLSGGIRILLTWVLSRFVYGLTHDLSMALYDRIIRQPYGLYIKRNSAEVLSGMEKVHYVGIYLLNPMMTALSSLIIMIGIIALLLYLSPIVALVTGASVGVVYGLLAASSRRTLLQLGREQASYSTQRIKVIQESLGGLRDIILDRSHERFSWQFRQIDARLRQSLARTNFISLAPRYVVEAFGIVLIALFALYYAQQPEGVLGAIPILGAIALAAQRLLPLAQNVNLAYVQYSSTTSMVSDVLELLEAPVIAASTLLPNAAVEPLLREIELNDVGFEYEPGQLALADLTMTVKKGARVGIVGRTGSGKSTLVDLLMGLLEPTTGQIRVDGKVLNGTTLRNWQAQVAHVPQAIFLIDDSIAANIAFGDPAAAIDLERVAEAARRAEIAEFVASLPEGLMARVGERGVRLSGGQRQRIGIARALYKRATVLILDEATSALDDTTEHAIMNGIEALDRELTVFMIAHRLTTLSGCDRVVRLEHGKLVHEGSYAALVRDHGLQGRSGETHDASGAAA